MHKILYVDIKNSATIMVADLSAFGYTSKLRRRRDMLRDSILTSTSAIMMYEVYKIGTNRVMPWTSDKASENRIIAMPR